MAAVFAKDAAGNDMLVSPMGGQVMMQWEQGYMEALVDGMGITTATSVLEIGFGLAFSATRIQSHKPASHTIVEVCQLCECDATPLSA